MKEIAQSYSYYVQYNAIVKRQYGHLGDYVEYPIDLSHIKTEFDSVLYDKILRSFMSKKKKEERDKKTHMVDVA